MKARHYFPYILETIDKDQQYNGHLLFQVQNQ